MCVDTCSPPGACHIVYGYGMPKKGGTYGNMVVAYKIKYPEKLTDIQKQTMKNIGL